MNNKLYTLLIDVSGSVSDYTNFIDAYNFDVRAVKKSCVHIVNKDNKIIPFETMNLFYRDNKKQRLEELKAELL